MPIPVSVTVNCKVFDDYYNKETSPDKGLAEIIIAKQRNGALGTCQLGWKGEYTWFMDLDPSGKEVQNPAP